MGIFDEIVESIKSKLSADTSLEGINFINSYRSSPHPNPIRNPYVAIGISSVDSSYGAFGNFLGQENGNEFYGKNCIVTISLRIYSPKTAEGEKCSEIFSKMFDCLFLDNNFNRINKVSCKEVAFDKNSDAYYLDCFLKMNVFIGNKPEEMAISDIEVKGEI